jgi:glycosyltransferase involved in cell wall biosynthesis
MFRDFSNSERRHEPSEHRNPGLGPIAPIGARFCRQRAEWSVLVPFVNERGHLAGTIESLAAQTEPFVLILVDNGSTDESASIGQATCQRLGLNYMLIAEPTPGKVAALAAGLRQVRTRYVATCDADTWYPAGYLAGAGRLLTQPGVVAAGAYFVQPDARRREKWLTALGVNIAARLLARQCHAGGAGQSFRTEALRHAGGFDPHRWNYVLEDHEIMHRVQRLGRMAYALTFWCAPSPRPRDRAWVKWTAFERWVYLACVAIAGGWFFEDFLAPRLASRCLTSERLRETSYQNLANG